MDRAGQPGTRQWPVCLAADQQRDLPERGADTSRSTERGNYPDQGERNVMDVDYPYHFDQKGRTAQVGSDEHIRDLIEQVLFTMPGERVNRPTFGSGLMELVFAPNSDELATATQFLVQGALQQWLGELIMVEEATVSAEESKLQITVVYTIRRSQERQVAQFNREAS
jgi:Bacteriophage baseplate protein W